MVRPENPALALQMAKALIGVDASDERFAQILQAQPYTYVGLLGPGPDPKLVNEHGDVIGELRPGDSFVDPSAIQRPS